MKIIDIHAHTGKWMFHTRISNSEIIKMLDKFNSEKAIFSSSLSLMDDLSIGNEKNYTFITSDKRCYGYIVVNPNHIEESKKQLSKYLGKEKVIGIKMHPEQFEDPVNSNKNKELLKIINSYGMPVLAVTAVGKEMVRDARYIGLASRMAAELGVHIVKTYFVDGFDKVVQKCPVPIVIAGGKKTPEKEALQMAFNAIEAGAIGVDMGRNIFQSDSPVGMIKAVRSIVHEDASVDEAFDIYINEKSG